MNKVDMSNLLLEAHAFKLVSYGCLSANLIGDQQEIVILRHIASYCLRYDILHAAGAEFCRRSRQNSPWRANELDY